jgi:hypothetical protein
MDHSEAIISAFIRPERAPRYLALLAKRGGREKLRAKLAHLADLDPRFAQPVHGSEATPQALERLLKAKGAPARCYCLSEDSEIDGKDLPLSEALEQVVGSGMGTFISCLPGRLGTSKMKAQAGDTSWCALLSNKRMQLAGALVLGNVGLCTVDQSPQLMRGPLGRRTSSPC